jgi:hypothetical protein
MEDINPLDPISNFRKRGWAMDAAVAFSKCRKGKITTDTLLADAEIIYQFLQKDNAATVLTLVEKEADKGLV